MHVDGLSMMANTQHCAKDQCQVMRGDINFCGIAVLQCWFIFSPLCPKLMPQVATVLSVLTPNLQVFEDGLGWVWKGWEE